MRERKEMPPLSDEQRALLRRLPDDGDGERIAGAAIRSADLLVRRHLARCLERERDRQAGRYLRTPTGAREAAADLEAPRVRRLLERLARADASITGAVTHDERMLVRVVFGHLGLDAAVVKLRAAGFTSKMTAASAVQLLTEQEVAP